MGSEMCIRDSMKILDEIRAYNGKLNYMKLVELVTRINNRVNAQVNQGT